MFILDNAFLEKCLYLLLGCKSIWLWTRVVSILSFSILTRNASSAWRSLQRGKKLQRCPAMSGTTFTVSASCLGASATVIVLYARNLTMSIPSKDSTKSLWSWLKRLKMNGDLLWCLQARGLPLVLRRFQTKRKAILTSKASKKKQLTGNFLYHPPPDCSMTVT